MSYRIALSPAAEAVLNGLLNGGLRTALERRIEGLRQEPAEQGLALVASLRGLYALRTQGGWCRIVYRVGSGQVDILALHMGPGSAALTERDWPALARRLFRLRLL